MSVVMAAGAYGIDRVGGTHGPFSPREGDDHYPFGLDPHRNSLVWTAEGRYYGPGDPHRLDIASIIPAPAPVAPPADPIAHLFEDVPEVPASRKFVGGIVYHSVSIKVDAGGNSITISEGGRIVMSAGRAGARLLAAALIAAANTPEEK
jgi:hypothetical protein